MTPMKAIREKCLDCCGGSAFEVRECPVSACPLHIYRFGRNPARKGIGGKSGLFDSSGDLNAEESADK